MAMNTLQLVLLAVIVVGGSKECAASDPEAACTSEDIAHVMLQRKLEIEHHDRSISSTAATPGGYAISSTAAYANVVGSSQTTLGSSSILASIHDKAVVIKMVTTGLFCLLLCGLWLWLPKLYDPNDLGAEAVETEKSFSSAVCAEDYTKAEPQILKDILLNCQGSFLSGVDGRNALRYERLREFLDSTEATLWRFGIESSDRVALLLGNVPEVVVAIFAFTCHCAVYPMDPKISEDELMFVLKDLPAKAVVALPGHMGRVKGVKTICLTPHPEVVGLFSLSGEVCTAPPPPGQPCRDDTALLLHTSGSTKKPKLVPLSHENLLLGAMCIRDTIQLKSTDTCLNMMPLYHIGGLSCNIFATAAASARVICAPQFAAEQGLGWLETLKPSWYYAGPTIHQLVMIQAEAEGKVPIPNSLQFVRSGSAALLPSVGAKMQKTFGCLVLPTYSMTECMPVCSHQRGGIVDLESVGPAAAPSLRIVDGEVCISGPSVTKGYEVRSHMDEDPNLAAFDVDGWFRTGDIGTIDANGYVFLSGRSKDIINRGGEKIAPAQVEDVLKDSRVLELVVFSVPHEELGEVVGVAAKAPDVPEASILDLLSDLRGNAATSIPQTFLPEVIVIVDEMIKGRTGKIMRIGLAKTLGLPRMSSSEDGSGKRAFTYLKGQLAEVDSPQQQKNDTVALDSLGIKRRGQLVDPREAEVAKAIYGISALLVVCDHFAWYFGSGLQIFPYMKPWTAAVLEAATRSGGDGWRLNCIVMCTSYLNAFEPLQGVRLIVQIGTYIILNSDSAHDFFAWLAEMISGNPPGTCFAVTYQMYFLEYLIICQVVFSVGRRLPLPALQCLVVFAALMWAYSAEQDDPFVTKYFGIAPYNFLFIYMVVGHYGHRITNLLARHVRSSKINRRIAAAFAAVALFAVVGFQVSGTLPFFKNFPTHAHGTIYKATWFQNAFELVLDIGYSFVICSLLVAFLGGSGLYPLTSWIGTYGWSIFCTQGLFMYCRERGVVGWSWGITVQGVVILPSLQSAVEGLHWSAILQLAVIPAYAVILVVLVSVPYHMLHMQVVKVLQDLNDRIWRTMAA